MPVSRTNEGCLTITLTDNGDGTTRAVNEQLLVGLTEQWENGVKNGGRLRYLGIDWPPLFGESALMARKLRVHFPRHFIT